MISVVLVVSAKGQLLIEKQYKHDVKQSAYEHFMKKIDDDRHGHMQPHWTDDGTHYHFIKRNNVYFVAATRQEISPILVIELLSKIYHICKDFCGVINEESIKTNTVLIYELMDEIMDYGFVQIASTDKLKPYIQSDPVMVRSAATTEVMVPGLFGLEHRVTPSNAADKPVIQSRANQERKNEIFVDIIEKTSVLVDSKGSVVRAEVNGMLNMKSFVLGHPRIKMMLNEDLVINVDKKEKGYNRVHLDECSFHSNVDLTHFHTKKMLVINPPDGQFSAMTYKLSGDLPISIPFRLFFFVEESQQSKDITIGLKLRCEIPSSACAVNVTLKTQVPSTTTGITQQFSGPGQNASFLNAEKKVLWNIERIKGNSEVTARFKLISPGHHPSSCMELGPAVLEFEISSYVPSHLQVKQLTCEPKQAKEPNKWVRYITTAESYMFKL